MILTKAELLQLGLIIARHVPPGPRDLLCADLKREWPPAKDWVLPANAYRHPEPRP